MYKLTICDKCGGSKVVAKIDNDSPKDFHIDQPKECDCKERTDDLGKDIRE